MICFFGIDLWLILLSCVLGLGWRFLLEAWGVGHEGVAERHIGDLEELWKCQVTEKTVHTIQKKRGRVEGGGWWGRGVRPLAEKQSRKAWTALCRLPNARKKEASRACSHCREAGLRTWMGAVPWLCCMKTLEGCYNQPVRKWRNEKNRNNNRILLLTVFNTVWFSIYRPWGSVNNIFITHDAAYCKHALKIFCSPEWHPITSGVCTPRSGYWWAETLGWGRRNVLLESCPWFLNSNGVSFAPLLHVFLVAHSLPKLTLRQLAGGDSKV